MYFINYNEFGIFTGRNVNCFVKFGVVLIFNSVYLGSAQNENTGPRKPIISEPVLTTRDQYIIIGCVIGITVSLLLVLLIGFFIKYSNKSNGKKPNSNKDYNSLDKIMPNGFNSGSQDVDRKLAKSAQMYHYQLSKQSLIEQENSELEKQGRHKSGEDSNSDEESTVYECHGLGKMQNMEIRNPLFDGASSVADASKEEQPADPSTR